MGGEGRRESERGHGEGLWKWLICRVGRCRVGR
jgi:hypothetical protein